MRLRVALVAAAVLLWALRLGLHIAMRTAGITDDPRYAALRRGWGAQASRQMWLLVQKQALVSIPLGFLGAFVGTLLSKDTSSAAKYNELLVRSNTGLGAEKAGG
jgi:steroid 5-alpha reductase family enzyme